MNRESVSQELKDSQLKGNSSFECSALFPEMAYRSAFGGQFCPSSLYTVNGIRLSQEFRFFVVIDFEATCDKEKIPDPQEIIEFPSVIVDSMTGEIVSCFQTYVRPTYHQQLTNFCKELTGIQQHQVDTGVTLSEAILRHDEWLEKWGIKKNKFAVVTWSNWDCQVMLESECKYKKFTKPSYFNRWINLRVPFHEVFGGGKCTLKQAVEIAGLPWTGRAHCGLDDAINTARLLSLLLYRGVKLFITDSLNQELGNQHFPLYEPDTEVQNLYPRCFCGIISKKRTSSGGKSFFVCGNWTPATGAHCKFFQFLFV